MNEKLKIYGENGENQSQRTHVSLKNILQVKDPKLSRQIRETCNLQVFSALFLLLVGSGSKWSMPIEKLGSSSLVSSIFQREGKLHCSLTGRKLWSQVEKMLTSSDLRTGVRKRLNRTYIGQARALCYNWRLTTMYNGIKSKCFNFWLNPCYTHKR